MASFSVTHIAVYQGPGVPLIESNIDFVETITDGEADTTFEQGDSITDSVGTGTYVGTMTIDGEDWPVAEFSGVNFVVYSNRVLNSVPSTLNVNANATFLCFLESTEIATPKGPVAVEALHIGDLVTTAGGAAVPVKWIGRQMVSTRFGPAERVRPVRVKAGALGNGLPVRDLVLTADHALMIDDLLVNAGALVNHDTIVWVPLNELGERFTVYHVETENHDIILAEGAPAETSIDVAGRRTFDNYQEYLDLFSVERVIPELTWPRISSARTVPETIKARIGLDIISDAVPGHQRNVARLRGGAA